MVALDQVGHEQIREISTRAWHRSYMARGMRRVPTYYQDLVDIIGSNPGHVIGSTACLGGCLPIQLLRYRESKDANLFEKIKVWIKQIDNIFGHGNFYFELQPSKNEEQIYVNRSLMNLGEEFDIKCIITTDTHYLKKEDRKIHKAYLNAQNGDREVDDFYATTYMMGTEELESYFDYLQDYELDLIYGNIQNIINRCEDYSLQKPLKIPQLKWKHSDVYIDQKEWISKIPMLENFWASNEYGGALDWANECLADEIIAGIRRHPECDNEETYKEINECLKMTWASSNVNKASWASYFLNLQQIIEECWEAGTLVGCGRGSGVGFILLYLLDIIQINPLRETTQTFRWRFLNPDRVSVLDVDVDIEGGRRAQVLNHLRKSYGEDRVANVITFKTEKSKSAILTACRGLGVDVDIAQYLASLIPADRGMLRSLDQCMYGDEENDWPAIKQFVFEMSENYPEVWEVAHKVENLVCGMGVHAGGVIFVDEPFTSSTALMRSPKGDIITAFDLHDCEDCSLIKYDLLSVEALDKMHFCLDLLAEQNYIEKKDTLKETYENVIGIYNLERTDHKMWEMIWNHEISSLFQMEKQSGIQGISLVHPESVDDLATLNSVIRLMAQEKGAEQPLNKFARFKNNVSLWYDEMRSYGLTESEMKILEPVVKLSYGICESQEGFMQLVQMPECGGFDLTWADSLRKSIAKKNPAAYEKLKKEYFEEIKKKGLSENLCNYVWNVLVATSKGYGFNKSHTLAYSLIALQEMNLAFKYPIIFWNCACLIADSGGAETEMEDGNDEEIIREDDWNESNEISVEDFGADDEPEEDDNSGDSDTPSKSKSKKSAKSSNYGKIATAIGKMKMANISIGSPDINKSTYTFSPDVENSTIRYGMSGIVKVGEDLIKRIIDNRPYTSIEDFLSKVKINKPQMINLIKAGAFDKFGDRVEIMRHYVGLISDQKKRITLQNMKMLIDFGLIPDEYDLERRVYNFNKYLKKFKLDSEYFGMDNIAFNFFSNNFDIDKLVPAEDTESGFKIKQIIWENIYQKHMDIIRPYVKNNNIKLLNVVNERLMAETWNKYCLGNLSKWEMDSISCYLHNHELEFVDYLSCGCKQFFDMPEEPVIDRIVPIKGKQVPLFKIERIMGTVLDRDKAKKTVSLLTTDGVVTVKIFGDVFAHYDRQISARGADGKKHVIEKSWFSRGNKIIITGVRREDAFIAKKYKNTPYHLVELITDVDGVMIETKETRVEVE